ncbi:hypothetical protein ACWGH5_37375 [Streptomyces sp. NPDC054864]
MGAVSDRVTAGPIAGRALAVIEPHGAVAGIGALTLAASTFIAVRNPPVGTSESLRASLLADGLLVTNFRVTVAVQAFDKVM